LMSPDPWRIRCSTNRLNSAKSRSMVAMISGPESYGSASLSSIVSYRPSRLNLFDSSSRIDHPVSLFPSRPPTPAILNWWNMSTSTFSLAVVVLVGIVMAGPEIGGNGSAFAGGYDRPAKNPRQSRSVVFAEHGIVATSQPLAAQVGLDILKQGGNA